MSSETEYVDFELSIEKVGENGFLVRAESCGGEVKNVFTCPFNQDQLALIDATLTKVALRASSKTRSSSAPEVKKMKEVGSSLFEQTVSGPIREFYYKCQGQADQQGKGIRWRLAVDSSLSNLPWEFLYFKNDFLALDPRSPIVRYIRVDAKVSPLKEEHPLRLLVVIASPSDEVPLDTTAERERINAAVNKLAEQDLLEVTYIEGPDTWSRLCDELLSNRTHILHFIGHGSFDETHSEGVLIMEDAGGKADPIDSERLRVLMKGKSRLRLVVLNSCLGTEGDAAQPFSSTAAGLVASGIPAVIAMQFEISDNAALEIARTFYTSLALNFPVDKALTEARRKIYLSNRDSLEWATPVLYMQVPDGQLFQFETPGRRLPAFADTIPPVPDPAAIAVIVDSASGRETRLGPHTIKIGRGDDNDINVDEAAVSREHAVLTRADETYSIKNLGGSGTFVNGKEIDGPIFLKHNDVIGIGTVRFTFRLLSELTGAAKPKSPGKAVARRASRTVTAEPKENEIFAEKAARNYEAGLQSMINGKWSEALAAFNSARTYAPGYQDVDEKISVCEFRFKVAKLYVEAKKLCAEKNYSEALQALDEATRLDPHLVDEKKLRELSECGQKYLQAMDELRQGNRTAGAALLREVISQRPDFVDAEKSLDDLARGGTGIMAPPPSAATDLINKGKKYGMDKWDDWFGSKPATTDALVVSDRKPLVQPPDARGFLWRTYRLDDPDIAQIVSDIEQYFRNNQYDHQSITENGVSVIQGRKTGAWRSLVGMGQTATVLIEPIDDGLRVSIGGAKWFARGGGIATGFLTGGVTWATSAVGVFQEQQLMGEIWQIVESFVKAKGGIQLALGQLGE